MKMRYIRMDDEDREEIVRDYQDEIRAHFLCILEERRAQISSIPFSLSDVPSSLFNAFFTSQSEAHNSCLPLVDSEEEIGGGLMEISSDGGVEKRRDSQCAPHLSLTAVPNALSSCSLLSLPSHVSLTSSKKTPLTLTHHLESLNRLLLASKDLSLVSKINSWSAALDHGLPRFNAIYVLARHIEFGSNAQLK
eukprot:CAMPEP_0175047936 /NCGR_PEP_ID=MMETSP0052_2-20121109/5887_1 /TAXON_ID=51329 ORGANISM="Polytomella parva, Strain SAG 63-3" /NCGR_SAMPLE_ID=MMETSP0052_2 /ASSEMBLY_ACC=CAM_ASM_000194 /LENGTH=192 /DNA_ID=CAMNT_0016311897 /DNA_START=646 /DNA_END=1221 /DNA_ORIENTATION=+